MDTNNLGRCITEYRKKNKLTQAAFAEILFVSNKTVSRWETGKGEPDLQQLARISELIGVPVSALIGGAAADESGTETENGAPARKKRFPVALFVCLALLLVAAAVIPPVLVFSGGGGKNDVPPDGDLQTAVVTDKFEAEYAQLKAVNPQLDGTDSFVERSATASNGLHIAYFGAKGNTLTFAIDADRADGNAMLYVSVVSEWDDVNKTHVKTDFDTVWELYVNDERIKVGASYVSPHDDNPYHDFVEVSVRIALKAGANTVKLVCPHTGDGQYGLNTDYIRIETDATLSWVPQKENKIRPD